MPEYDAPAVHEMLGALPDGTKPIFPDGCDGGVDSLWLSVALMTAHSADLEVFDQNRVGDEITVRGVVARRSREPHREPHFVFAGSPTHGYPDIRCLMPDVASMGGVHDGEAVTVVGQSISVQSTQGGNGPIEIIFTVQKVVWA